MRGLLIKDIRLMKNMRNSLILILLIAAGMSTYISDMSFLIIYLGLIGATFTNSTISYDEFDNGYAFLLSLPVTRKIYVKEKYVFGMMLCGGGWLTGTIIAAIAGWARGNMAPLDTVQMALMMFPMVMFLLAVLLPFHLKYGPEKGRIVMIGAMGVFFVLVVLVAKVADRMNIRPDALEGMMLVMGTGVITVGALAIGLVILLLSCRISMAIMKKKEF